MLPFWMQAVKNMWLQLVTSMKKSSEIEVGAAQPLKDNERGGGELCFKPLCI